MNDNEVTPREQMLVEALIHLQQAITVLDTASAPGHIAAHVDLAINQLENELRAIKAYPEIARAKGLAAEQ
jgi:hypothetical protein